MKPLSSLIISFLLLLASTVLTLAAPVSITQKVTGKSLEVEIQGVENGQVSFKMLNGDAFTIPLADLTDESIESIRAEMKTAAPAGSNSADGGEPLEGAEKLNEIIGHDFFGDAGSLWIEEASDLAERLQARVESEKKNSSSYRLYPRMDYQFLGAHPYCVTLYGEGGDENRPERLSLVFANKGDFGSQFGMGRDHFKVMHPDKEPPIDLNAAIEIDAEVISVALTAALGEAKSQYYGEKEDKRKVQRWDVGDHSFLLSSLEDEYVSLLVVPTSDADAQGKTDRILDSEFKKIQITNVQNEDNGDVWIDNIPMVNQGPKGYCAPATFERAMRYMQVPADMYLLATAATSEMGTDTQKLSEDCKRIVRSKARRIKELDLDEDFEIKELKKFIDKGVPVLWQMRSLEEYNDIADKRTTGRKSVTDFSEWAGQIQSEADSIVPQLENNDTNHHICMVIGYNEATSEVAVSDSWGPKFELRWVHVDIAKAVTSRGGFAIDF